ncbi:hypothetical protein [Agromyces soli]|uniref:Uncharacterized protein n=1 Tax=Agromyces soli TaxID=659012 RepID=A0ABY4APN7_9MICO|nr:hypothetical protein [Agromyces soli]UOE25120.1 hypothetical protein MTP13_12260 [Agromyces soli]
MLQSFSKLRRSDGAVGGEFYEALLLRLQIVKLALERGLRVGIGIDHALERRCKQLP